jgi:hypothetical protein
LKQYLKELEEDDPEDLIGEGDLDPDREDLGGYSLGGKSKEVLSDLVRSLKQSTK